MHIEVMAIGHAKGQVHVVPNPGSSKRRPIRQNLDHDVLKITPLPTAGLFDVPIGLLSIAARSARSRYSKPPVHPKVSQDVKPSASQRHDAYKIIEQSFKSDFAGRWL
jgi:hypothetical protein